MFFPYSDDNPTERVAVVTILIIVANVVIWVFFQGMGLDEALMANALCNWGFIPGELTGRSVGHSLQLTSSFACVVDPVADWRTLITTQFLHGGWMHLIGNMLFLWIFGNNIEDCMGHFRFLVFYLLCGVAASLSQIVSDPSSIIPAVGASGAVSGVLGAYLLLYPKAKVRMVVFFFVIITRVALPAWLYLIAWFGMQFFSGVSQLASRGIASGQEGGVAFFAHIGGFLAGMLFIYTFADDRYLRRHALRNPLRR